MRRRKSSAPPYRHSQPSGGKRNSLYGKRPPKEAHSPKPTPTNRYQAPERPTHLVAEVIHEGAFLKGRVLHRDLHQLSFTLQLPKGLEVQAGQFVQGMPAQRERNLLVVESIVPASRAAIEAALCNHQVPRHFTADTLKETKALPAYTWSKAHAREDWRKLPIITIDGEDAKDFDDAVWAEAWEKDGHFVRVAIADVTHYVGPHSPLDKTAQERGTSNYFPGFVVPMLPERLSNDLCSLVPHEDRPVLGAELWIDASGQLKYYRFCRAVIHSAARCTYTQVQGVLDGHKTTLPSPVLQNIMALNAAYQTLWAAREARGAISLEVPELFIQLDKNGKVTGATPRERTASHMLIEELMITANVAAATALTNGVADTRPTHLGGGPRKHKGVEGVYRVHAQPSREKLENLRNVLSPLGFTAPAPTARPAIWAALAKKMQSHPAAPTLQRALLQTQMQAQYATDNIGHFGLALPLYTHFTSPIRRYADVLVHRGLLALLEEESNPSNASKLCPQINICERRSQQAEWEARDRLLAGFMAEKVGQVFTGTITNVAPFGCFLALEGGLAEAMLPKWHLEDYAYIGGQNAFRKTRGGKGLLRAGATLKVKLIQADFAAGRLTVGLADAAPASHPLTARPKRY